MTDYLSFRVGYNTNYKGIDYVCVAIVPKDYYVAILKNDDMYIIVDERRNNRLPYLLDVNSGIWTFTEDKFITGPMSDNYQEIIDWNLSKKFPDDIQFLIDIVKKYTIGYINDDGEYTLHEIDKFKEAITSRNELLLLELKMELRLNERSINKLKDRNEEIKKISEILEEKVSEEKVSEEKVSEEKVQHCQSYPTSI